MQPAPIGTRDGASGARAIEKRTRTTMTISLTGRKRIRKTFGRIPEITRMPNLIEVQKSSYDAFLQIGVAADERR
ncbi:MAG: hypothetical protein WEC00_06850, partial [Dongiaceae bacterium]